MSFVIILRSIIKWFGETCNMGTMYLVNILHNILIYSKYTLINVTIILRLFMLIMLVEYTCNMVI
jgi:hypothetical protein